MSLEERHKVALLLDLCIGNIGAEYKNSHSQKPVGGATPLFSPPQASDWQTLFATTE